MRILIISPNFTRNSKSYHKSQSIFHFQGDIPLEQLDYALFSGLEGDHFKIALNPRQKINAQLIEVKNTPSDDGRQERFSLLFEANAKDFLEQRMYDFEHPAIGNFSIFIVPVGSDGNMTQYEAVFNRLLA